MINNACSNFSWKFYRLSTFTLNLIMFNHDPLFMLFFTLVFNHAPLFTLLKRGKYDTPTQINLMVTNKD